MGTTRAFVSKNHTNYTDVSTNVILSNGIEGVITAISGYVSIVYFSVTLGPSRPFLSYFEIIFVFNFLKTEDVIGVAFPDISHLFFSTSNFR